jgi:hypothetical protein
VIGLGPNKAEIQAKYHEILVIYFEDQKLTSFSGLFIFQSLFRQKDYRSLICEKLREYSV